MNVSPLVSINDLQKAYKSEKYASESAAYFKKILPIFPSPDLAAIAADLMTDGHIAVRKYYNSKKYAYVGFFSDDISELERFNSRLKRVFKIEGAIKEWGFRKNGRSKGCIISNARLARLLVLCKIPAGDKVQQRYKIPSWVVGGSKEIQRAFLRRSFTCEGSISREKGGRWGISYTMYKFRSLAPNTISYLESIRKLLRGFGIKTYVPYVNQKYVRTKDKQEVVGFVLRMRDKQSLITYTNEIGFDTEVKQSKLSALSNQIGAGINR
ncbi:MAG: LAGLIDADG family homing endonuclease [Candidatus Micrarchaeia archaeon]